MATYLEIMDQHQRTDSGSCSCGWAELGRSHMAHVDFMLRDARKPRSEAEVKAEAFREAADEADSVGHHWSGPSAHAFFELAESYRTQAYELEQS